VKTDRPLEEVFLIKRIPAWSRNLSSRAVGTAKLAFVDSGVRFYPHAITLSPAVSAAEVSATCASGCGRPRWEKSSAVGRPEPGADPVVNGGPAEDARVVRWRGHRLLAGGGQGQGGALAAGAARLRVIVTL
jgi:hypothetical protein